MLHDSNKESRLQELLTKLASRISALYLLNTDTCTYEEIFADHVFHSRLAEKGTFKDVYHLLFTTSKSGEELTADNYQAFANDNIFKQDNYTSRLDFRMENNRRKRYDYRILRISESESLLIFIESALSVEAERYEQMKMDAMQENFLFSMIVDLKSDSCRNFTTTEITADRPDYIDLKYSQWRYIIANMFLPDDKSMFFMITEPEYIIHRLEQEPVFKFEIQMQNMVGKYIWVRLMFHRMHGFSREMPVFVYTVQDIHQDILRLLQQENIISAIEEQNNHLDNINKAKSVFISNMSHEIRTPINAVLGMNEMIIRETKDDNIRAYAYDIRSAGKMLLSIINDILDFSKIESGKMEIVPLEYSTETMIRDINNLLSTKIKEKDLVLKTEISPRLPSELLGDELRIKQIIVNLLTNAVKYTEKGTITFSMEPIPQEEGIIGLSVKVADTGIGMRQEEMDRLFTDFERLDEKRNHNIEGSGLGMGIAMRLLEQMGSRLKVESEYGKGSVFSFVLSQKVVDPTPMGELQLSSKKSAMKEESHLPFYAPNAKVLIVDDTKINLSVAKGLLKRTGVQLECAQSGRECLQILAQKDFDLIFLDHLMPEMDGIETLTHIREMGEKYKTLPVIALTANVMSGARERYLNAGFTDFLEKPINAARLDEMLLTYLPAEYIGLPD